MNKRISHHRNAESFLVKAQWFQSLSIEERMELLCEYTDLILENNPHILESKHAKSITGHIQVLKRT